MFITAIAIMWKFKYPLIDGWISKIWYIHTMKYSAFKRKEILIYATTWTDLEDVMLSEISQSQKTNTVLHHLYKILRVVKFIETESRMETLKGYGRWGMESCYLMGIGFQFCKMKRVLEIVVIVS